MRATPFYSRLNRRSYMMVGKRARESESERGERNTAGMASNIILLYLP